MLQQLLCWQLIFLPGALAGAALTALANEEKVSWRNTEEMRLELQKPLGITWSSRPLRDALNNLAEVQRVAIWLDRRIDPGAEPEFSFENTPLQQILRKVANQLGAELGSVGPVIYIGPPSIAVDLWTIAEIRNDEVQKLPPPLRQRWTQSRAMSWPLLTTPREIVQNLAEEAGCQIENLETIPHDLWPAVQLPPMTLPERLTLVLAGFDRTFEWVDRGQSIRLVGLPDRPVLQREYAPRGTQARTVSELTKRFPNAVIQSAGTKVLVRGSAEDHNAIAGLLRGDPDRRTVTGPAVTRYTMKAENQPLGVVLKTLNVKAQLQVSVDPDAQAKLYGLVSFDVKDATLEQLLTVAMENTGLTFQLEGQSLRVKLAPP